ncbi:hypothetical protein KSX_14680 [Ktedonospora formicarum]|uniref:Orc1-like AAA ATPase domain-containing protein n=1 Tax=Ktedonospora formicarum TaxID=2778364 RepID=A0A8J3HY79_9CHLR|nr:hypothetical protein KSX_14680 [Ktedonospora formicarum]
MIDGDITRERVAHVFLNAIYARQDAERLADLILATLGIEGETTTDRENIFSAWRLLIEVLAQQAPRILIFEDLHWASESLFDLVEYITHLRTQAPLMLIALSRPELLDRRPNWGGGQQNFTSLALQPLSPRYTQELISRLTQDLPQAVRTRIAERSGGNPFFALELLRGLQERSNTSDSSEQLPDTVHAAVQTRLDQLSRPERDVLQVASVAGRAFSMTMLAEVLSEYSLSSLQQALDGLLERDILAPSESHTYAFRHILFRDVSYGTLARTQRVRLHEKLAVSLENINATHLDEYTELIAYHYHEAVTLSRQSAVRTQLHIDTTRAIDFLRRAARLASHAGAYTEAQNNIQSAIAIASEKDLVELHEALGDSLYWSRTTIEAYHKAFTYWEKQNPSPDAAQSLIGARILRKLLIHYTRGGQWERIESGAQEIQPLLKRAQQLVEASGNDYERWRVQLVQCFIQIPEPTDDERRALLPLTLDAVAYFEQLGDTTALSEALDARTALYMRLYDYSPMLETALRRYAIPNLSATERGDALQMIALAYQFLHKYEELFDLMRHELKQIRPGQSLIPFGASLSQVVNSAFTRGNWSLIEELYPQMEEIREQSGNNLSTFSMFDGYLTLTRWALAREDQPLIDAMGSFVRRASNELFNMREQLQNMIDVYQSDDITASKFDLTEYSGGTARGMLLFCMEHNLSFPPKLVENTQTDSFGRSTINQMSVGMAEAMLNNDSDELESHIDQLEEMQAVVHAARMRIVLAERNGDRSHLERARLILEGIQDRQFLRRLNDVAERLP